MTTLPSKLRADLDEAARQMDLAARAAKCRPCGCFHDALDAIQRGLGEGSMPPSLRAAVARGRESVETREYDCLGCAVCFPAIALNALQDAGVEAGSCPTEVPEARGGWPPLPGDYAALRFQAPVAVCTLNDDRLAARLRAPGISIVGTLRTENLGIERVVANVAANPHIRFLIVCGADSEGAIGHRPGQSLRALFENGLDDRGRIVGAEGRRPFLKNVDRQLVEHFRKHVTIVDRIGSADEEGIADDIRSCAERDPGPAPSAPQSALTARVVVGRVPERMASDPAGYFVVYVDRRRGMLSAEHFTNQGVLDTIVEGPTAIEVMAGIVQEKLVSRLDHSAYLGRELARAERALRMDEPYVQDAAPEAPPAVAGGCACEEEECR